MAMIFLSGEDRAGRRSVKVLSTIQGASASRWGRADAGLYPDRCDCILEDLTNGVATHLTIQYGSIDGRRVAYRHGHCERNAPPSTPMCYGLCRAPEQQHNRAREYNAKMMRGFGN